MTLHFPGFTVISYLSRRSQEDGDQSSTSHFSTSSRSLPTLDRYHKIKALIRSFLLSQGGCAHMWQILLSLFVSTKNWFLWDGYTLQSPTLHLSTLGFQCINQQLVDNSFPHDGRGSPMVDVSTQCSEGSPSYPDKTKHSVVHGYIEHRLGSTLECCPVYGQQSRKHVTSTCSSWKPYTEP